MVLDVRGFTTVSHHSNGQSFPSWIDACRGRSVEPKPSFTHTVAGLWLERETAGREREETEKIKVGKKTRWLGFSFYKVHPGEKQHVNANPTTPLLNAPSSVGMRLPVGTRARGEE